MTDQKVTLTEDQWAYIKQHEDERTREINRHHATMQQLMADAVALVTKSQSGEDKRDWFAGQALVCLDWGTGFASMTEEAMKRRAILAYAQADALLAFRKSTKS